MSSEIGPRIRTETPGKVRWTDVLGYTSLVHRLRSLLVAFKEGIERAVRLGFPYERGILLYGPLGCGKHTLVRAAATELNTPLLYINLSSPPSSHQTLTTVLEQLGQALRQQRHSIVLEDPEGLLSWSSECKRAFVHWVLDLQATAQIPIFGITERPESVLRDVEIATVFTRVLYVPPPSRDDRAAIVHAFLSSSTAVADESVIDRIVEATEGLSVSEIRALMTKLYLQALSQLGEDERRPPRITVQMVDALKVASRKLPPVDYERLQLAYEVTAMKREVRHAVPHIHQEPPPAFTDLFNRLEEEVDLLVSLQQGLGRYVPKAFLVGGPPGCGKATALHHAFRASPVPVVELDAADPRQRTDPFSDIAKVLKTAQQEAPAIAVLLNIDAYQTDPTQLVSAIIQAWSKVQYGILCGITCNHPSTFWTLAGSGAFSFIYIVPPLDFESRVLILDRVLRLLNIRAKGKVGDYVLDLEGYTLLELDYITLDAVRWLRLRGGDVLSAEEFLQVAQMHPPRFQNVVEEFAALRREG